MANWPWKRAINPHYEEVKAESDAWVHSLNLFTPKSQRAFDKGDFCRVAALVYPRLGKEHLRTGCDMMNLYFVLDEYTDVEDSKACRATANIVLNAFSNPQKQRPDGENPVGEMTRQFWNLTMKTASPMWQRRFVTGFAQYLDSLVAEAADREHQKIRSVEAFLQCRRINVGAPTIYLPLILASDLPEEVLYHPVIIELTGYINDMVIIDNDMCSYNREQATGHGDFNLVTVTMHEFHLTVNEAMNWAVDYHSKLQGKFLDGLKKVPSWGPEMDKQVADYLSDLGNCPRGNLCWNFESGRYFGDKGAEVERTRCVPLLPKLENDMTLRRAEVSVPMVELQS
ncbi:uncharacterized protein FIBRA_05798 [Fibroporia radiculosa]|uniref:Terpene synthase n=1 Tax=Fibroporia radiculosa TaxID=599839 RepID=J4H3Q5_9APHY|nr:uncharacterized protein FIBRA_05798 [Fibroporia radiculosa]CCM03654.1 predicted protein [Fibroporia radiculosa]